MPDDFEALYTKMKKEADRLRQERDRAQGALEPYLARLKAEFGAASLKEGEALLKKAEREEQKLKQEALAELEKMERNFQKQLEGGGD